MKPRTPMAALLAAFPPEQWEINTDAIMVGLDEVAVIGGAVDEGGHSGALLRLMKAAPDMRQALLAAAKQFDAYAAQHRAKGAPDGAAKAEVNELMAAKMRAALPAEGDPS